MGHLQELYERFRDKGLVVLGFNASDDRQIALDFMHENGATFPNILDASDAARQVNSQDYRSSGVPLNYIIDRDGKIVDAWYGYERGHRRAMAVLATTEGELAEAVPQGPAAIGELKPLGLLRLAMRIGIVPDLSDARKDRPPKVLVFPGSVAERAGIRSGDRIMALDGRTVKRIEDLLRLWGELKLDDGLGLTLLREGMEVEVDLAGNLLKGLERVGIVPDLSELGRNQPPKVQILPGSPAETAGIRSGDRITALNGRTVKQIDDVLVMWDQLKLDDGLGLTLLREGKQLEVKVPADLLEALLESSDRDNQRP